MIARILSAKSLFAAYLLSVVLLMVLPLNSGSGLNHIFVLHLRGDYLIHAALFLPWAFFGFLLQKRTWLWMFVGFLFAVCAEGIQYFLPYRAFNVNDVLSNTIGILLSFLLLFTILKMRSGLNL
jgi:VanZ family protein